MAQTTPASHPASPANAHPRHVDAAAARAALDTAWPRWRGSLLHYAARRTHPQDAEDLVQATYLKAVTTLNAYNPRTGPAGMYRWLRSLLANLCRHDKERAERRDEILLSPAGFVELLDGRAEGVMQEDHQTAVLLAEIEAYGKIAGLRRRRGEVWRLWRQGYSQAEIAAALGLTQQAISYHVGLIIDELRASAGDLITHADGYPSTTVMFNEHARVTIYRRPQRRGSWLANQKIKSLE